MHEKQAQLKVRCIWVIEIVVYIPNLGAPAPSRPSPISPTLQPWGPASLSGILQPLAYLKDLRILLSFLMRFFFFFRFSSHFSWQTFVQIVAHNARTHTHARTRTTNFSSRQFIVQFPFSTKHMSASAPLPRCVTTVSSLEKGWKLQSPMPD